MFTWLASFSFPSLLQIYNLKRDPIVGLEINKQRRIIKHETGGRLNLLGSGQPCDLGKETRNSWYRLRLLLINWTARQTIWWQQDLVLMSFQKGETTELQRAAPVESGHLTVYLPGLATASAFLCLNIGLFRSADFVTSRRKSTVNTDNVRNGELFFCWTFAICFNTSLATVVCVPIQSLPQERPRRHHDGQS